MAWQENPLEPGGPCAESYSCTTPRIRLIEPCITRASQVVLMVKNPPDNARDIKDAGLIPGSGRSPGEGHGKSLQYSCLDNPMDREA